MRVQHFEHPRDAVVDDVGGVLLGRQPLDKEIDHPRRTHHELGLFLGHRALAEEGACSGSAEEHDQGNNNRVETAASVSHIFPIRGSPHLTV